MVDSVTMSNRHDRIRDGLVVGEVGLSLSNHQWSTTTDPGLRSPYTVAISFFPSPYTPGQARSRRRYLARIPLDPECRGSLSTSRNCSCSRDLAFRQGLVQSLLDPTSGCLAVSPSWCRTGIPSCTCRAISRPDILGLVKGVSIKMSQDSSPFTKYLPVSSPRSRTRGLVAQVPLGTVQSNWKYTSWLMGGMEMFAEDFTSPSSRWALPCPSNWPLSLLRPQDK